MLGLLRACRECEPRFLARTLVQNLRVGANWRSVVPALARAVVLHREGPAAGKVSLAAWCLPAFRSSQAIPPCFSMAGSDAVSSDMITALISSPSAFLIHN